MHSLFSLTLFFSILLCFVTIYYYKRADYLKRDIKSIKLKWHELEVERVSHIYYSDSEMNIYYNHLRNEVVREDGVTHQRLTWSITIQGLFFGAMGVLIGLSWDGGEAIIAIRKIALLFLPIFGFAFAIFAHQGIWASRTAIRDMRDEWLIRNEVFKLYPDKVPQPFGRWRLFRAGSDYAMSIAKTIILIWAVVMALQTVVIVQYVYPVCATSEDVIGCMFTDTSLFRDA